MSNYGIEELLSVVINYKLHIINNRVQNVHNKVTISGTSKFVFQIGTVSI